MRTIGPEHFTLMDELSSTQGKGPFGRVDGENLVRPDEKATGSRISVPRLLENAA